MELLQTEDAQALEKSCGSSRFLHSISMRVHSWSAGSQESSGLKSVIAAATFAVSAPRSF